MNFTKMTGTGNDFVVIDDRENNYLGKEKEIALKLCDRHFSIGGDGVLLVRKSEKADTKMVIINSDGSRASMCGNGIRCFAKYVWDEKIVLTNPMTIETDDGIKKADLKVEDGKAKYVTINMGKPSLEPSTVSGKFDEKILDKKVNIKNKEYAITSFHMGVPHTMVFGKLDDYKIEEGKDIEKSDIFKAGTNVNFCEVVNKNKILVKTWERGAGATLACGTGSCASVIASNLLGYTGKEVEVVVPGGNIFIEIKEEGILMRGPANTCFRGEIDV